MKTIKIHFLLAATFLWAIGCKQNQPSFEAPVLKNIGHYSVPVTTESKHAQMFFNQGVIMANNFNHAEAERSFREAIRQDTTFAMGYWGIAYVLGPNFNSVDNMGTVNEIRKAVTKAVSLSDGASPWEQAVIKAIQIKFPMDTAATDAEGFADAMKQAFTQFPDNSFVATLYAESVMNLHPWDFYAGRGGAPRAWTPELVSLLEKVISIDSLNPLANHLYLHATEASSDLSKALISAQRLKTLVPSAGHLVHMPSHIYINTGDYHEGSVANEAAVLADSIYIAECQSQGYYPQMYYPHNYHFLAATAAFEGRGARSIEAAYKTASLIDKKYYHEPGYEMVQHYLTIPNHILIKFGQWEKILTLPQPTDDLIYPTAIWHYTKGMAYANLNKAAEAREELKKLNELSASPAIAEQLNWGINKVTDVCKISSKVLEAELYIKEGKHKEAIQLLSDAIHIEDSLNYNEPPDWFFSVRHILGNVLLKTKDYEQAEKIYREDLAHWPKNGFALNGLAESLVAQGKTSEAEAIKQQFTEAWKYADITLQASVIDPEKRKDLVLRIDEKSPDALVYLASMICMTKP
ncbi:tetratricopeptide repeat protein [Chryseolinea lacunae]|uniref:Tetratricopeptide repeat protein n=1 Tax=Chryseolinea lacunae TaxID=2801331 RepID=A0ABS1L299_9BACT|nr:tetratricopeptide repeat protein [Chryseolinea lacunae]MBL0745667.1 tetratricopeptide repeat protein [Chryseolinea lacunae]